MQVSQSTRNFGADKSKLGAATPKPAFGVKRQPTPKGSFGGGGSSRLLMADKSKSTMLPAPVATPAKKPSISTASDLKRTVSDTGKSSS
jgi:hypothetical protein